MSILEQARQDIADITANAGDFGVQIRLQAPNGATATITGLHTKIHLAVDSLGLPVNSRKAHISFSEKALEGTAYPVRNAAGEVNMKDHIIFCKDSTGIEKKYRMQQWFQNETIGLITCIIEQLI